MVAADWELALRCAWADLALHPQHTRQFRTRRLSTELSLSAHAGLRAVDNALCLVVDAQVPLHALFEVGGMRLTHAAGDDHPLLVLSLEDPTRADLFATVCADTVQAASGVEEPDVLESFLARLDAWRCFLREIRASLSKNETVGLIGELVILRYLLRLQPRLLSTWSAPDDGLHDFTRAGHSLEVKSTLGPGSSLHISNLDQLDHSGLRRLDLFHVRMAEGPDGESLGEMIQAIRRFLLPAAALRSFENALLRRGLMPADVLARSTPRVIITTLSGYSIHSEFPRIVRSSVPSAVMEAQYSLELRAIAQYSIDVGAAFSAFAEG